jgi:thiol-disulfide isomerase/thioredoxin
MNLTYDALLSYYPYNNYKDKETLSRSKGESFMAINKKILVFVLLFSIILILPGGASQGSETTTVPVNPVKSKPGNNAGVTVFELPIPGSELEKSYLGLSGTGSFKIGQIKAPVLIIQVFSFYCPHCQRTASQVNDLYQMIQARPDMKENIKMIGIGVTNSTFEVDTYKERYSVPFPLFSDQSVEISEKLGVKGTPTFIGLKKNARGFHEQFYFGEGGFQDTQQFLNEIIKLSGLK